MKDAMRAFLGFIILIALVGGSYACQIAKYKECREVFSTMYCLMDCGGQK